MKHLVVLTALPYYKDVLERISAVYPVSSVLRVDAANIFSIVNKLRTKPFYSDFYWVIMDCSFTIKEAKMLKEFVDSEWIRFVYLCPQKGIYNKVRDWLVEQGSEFELFNCYKVGYFAKVKFVRETFIKVTQDNETKLNKDLVHFIAKRINGYENQLEFLMTVAITQKGGVTRKSMSKLMPVRRYIYASNFMFSLMSLEPGDEEAIQLLRSLLSRYQNYYSPIVKNVNEFFTQYEKLYAEFISGRFNEKTCVHWVDDVGADFDISNEFMARKWLDIFNSYSFELLYSIKTQFNLCKRHSYYEAFAYIISLTSQLLAAAANAENDEGGTTTNGPRFNRGNAG